MTGRWLAPLDLDCPDAQTEVYDRIESMYEDPMSVGAPVDEFIELWTEKHRIKCKRCQAYGAANIEVCYD